jgi:diacylglycerol kinase family enzyme
MSSDVENLAANDNPPASRRLGHRPLSLLADELRSAGHEVIARNRTNRGDHDLVLSHIDELNIDQL